MIAMIGLAIGIDYTLFIVSRYREERERGLSVVDAITRAGDTAGKAVLFSGLTVVVSLLGMLIVPWNLMTSIAGAIVVVLVSVLMTLTLLPAVLGCSATGSIAASYRSSATGTAAQPVDQGYGLVCDLDGRPLDGVIVAEANQEHGILAHRSDPSRMPALPVGTLVRVLPNHACATAASNTFFGPAPLMCILA